MADEAKTPDGPTYSSVYVGPQEREMSAIKKLAGVSDGSTIESSSIEYEDEFRGKYGAQLLPGVTNGVQVIQPSISPKDLMSLMQHNNTLQQCADALVTNRPGILSASSPPIARRFCSRMPGRASSARRTQAGAARRRASPIRRLQRC